MLQFADFSSISEDTYLVVDEDTLYRWNIDCLKRKTFRECLRRKNEHTFKLEFEGTIASIAVYRGGECILCEEIEQVEFL